MSIPSRFTDIKKQVDQVRAVLSHGSIPLGFMLGAGCPASIKNEDGSPLIPGINQLSADINEQLQKSKYADQYKILLELCGNTDTKSMNVEELLNGIRSLKKINLTQRIQELPKNLIEDVDDFVCKQISMATAKDLDHKNYSSYHRFTTWLQNCNRSCPIEIFTTNYDTLFEQAFEKLEMCYFDGFNGSINAILDSRSIYNTSLLPSYWIRLWKIHGSINWTLSSNNTIVRTNSTHTNKNMMIFPSENKYSESRIMPYQIIMDRLRLFLQQQNAVLLACGYKFGDDHINSAIIEALKQNPSSGVIAFMRSNRSEYHNLVELAQKNPFIRAYFKDGAVLNGIEYNWMTGRKGAIAQQQKPYIEWKIAKVDNPNNDIISPSLLLGDFDMLTALMIEMLGRHSDMQFATSKDN